MWGVTHVEYWVTSDGMSFPTEEQANKHEEFIHSDRYPKTYCSGPVPFQNKF
jgi:hypothetical protein